MAALLRAASDGDVEAVRKELEEGADADYVDKKTEGTSRKRSLLRLRGGSNSISSGSDSESDDERPIFLHELKVSATKKLVLTTDQVQLLSNEDGRRSVEVIRLNKIGGHSWSSDHEAFPPVGRALVSFVLLFASLNLFLFGGGLLGHPIQGISNMVLCFILLVHFAFNPTTKLTITSIGGREMEVSIKGYVHHHAHTPRMFRDFICKMDRACKAAKAQKRRSNPPALQRRSRSPANRLV